MYIYQTFQCDCGAPMFETPVIDHPEMRAVRCVARGCDMAGVTRYVRLPRVPEDQLVNAEEIGHAT